MELQEPRTNRYVACEEINQLWDEPQIIEFNKMYKSGKTITDMATHFNRQKKEILILAVDQLTIPAFRNLITKRWGLDAAKQTSEKRT
jgi:peptidyl-tRNA hydrolase